MGQQQKIAVLCNYQLLPERVGGMDHFFWLFDQKCKANGVAVDWFFPNSNAHGYYQQMTLFSSEFANVEKFFCEQHNATEYTHIFTHFIELCTPYVKKIKKQTAAKLIMVDHNPRQLSGYPLKKRIEKRIKGILYGRYVDLFIGVSHYSVNQLKKELGRHFVAETRVIFNGINPERFVKKTEPSFTAQFIVASHLRKDKGIQDLISAVHEVLKKEPFQFVIDVYGTGYYEHELRQLCESLNVTGFFNFKGNVTNLNKLYSHYDYLIHPSHGETFCYSVVEALMCRLPVITTKNQGNILGLVHENVNGFLFDEENVSQLTQILHRILSQQVVIDNTQSYNTQIEALTLENMVDNYFNLIR